MEPLSQSTRTASFYRSFLGSLSFAIVCSLPACHRGSSSGGGFRLLSVEWGRRVSVVDAQGAMVRESMVIGADIVTTPQAYRLAEHPITQALTLAIEADLGTARFEQLFDALDDNLGSVQPVVRGSAGPFTAVARNAALRLVFDRAVDVTTIDTSAVQLRVGYEPSMALEYVWAVDAAEPNMLILDPVISPFESQRHGVATNSLGFPEGVGDQVPNIELRIPTREDAQGNVLTTLRSTTGSRLKAEKDAIDPTNPRDVVRLFRSGRSSDPSRGFLADLTPPRLVGERAISVNVVSGDQIDFSFDVALCERTPAVGDLVTQGARLGEVIRIVRATSPDYLVEVRRLDDGTAGWSALESASLRSFFDPTIDVPECFVEISPDPGTAPTMDVDPLATYTFTFDEPMSPDAVGAFDLLRMTRSASPLFGVFDELVVANVYPSADLRRLTFVPTGVGLAHQQGTAETYHLHMQSTINPSRRLQDLAGNVSPFDTVSVAVALDPAQPTVRQQGFVLRFAGADEDLDGRDDHQGQLLLEIVDPPGPATPYATGRLVGREVRHFSHQIDPTTPVIGIMRPLDNQITVKAPLSEYGSRVMSVWRYVDVGFSYPLSILHNLDVEGIAFSPIVPIQLDTFRRVRMRLSHALYLPDEYIDFFGGQLPVYPNSGLVTNAFEANRLDPQNHPPAVMFDGPFTLDPANAFRAPGGTTDFLPWPAFRDAFGERVTFTWRDTNVDALGGPAGDGADPRIMELVTGFRTRYVGPAQVPSLGLPLLLDVQVWPAEPGDETLGVNRFQTSIATTTSSLPTFRVYSEGGVDQLGNVVRVDPTDGTPRGGFNVDSVRGTIGAPLPPSDNFVYWGQIDFVIKVSRHITRWFGTGATGGFPHFAQPVVEPAASRQPLGTSLIVEYRGAATVTPNSLASMRGDCIDLYGRVMTTQMNANCTGTPGTATNVTPWTTDLTALDGSPWIQIRCTTVANTVTGSVPALDSIGIAYDPGT